MTLLHLNQSEINTFNLRNQIYKYAKLTALNCQHYHLFMIISELSRSGPATYIISEIMAIETLTFHSRL